MPPPSLDYKLLINMTAGDLHVDDMLTMSGTVLTDSVDQALETLERRGVPTVITMVGVLSNNTRDRRDVSIWKFVNSLKAYLERRETEKGYGLDAPIHLLTPMPMKDLREGDPEKLRQHQSSEAILNVEINKVNEYYALKQVLLRRHQKVMKEMSGAFETFMRLGKFGCCVQCPRIMMSGGAYLVLPEQCENKNKYDHNFQSSDLFASYSERMSRP